MSRPRPLRAFITAVQFLTRVPLRGGVDGPDDDTQLLVEAVGWYPLVGGLIGLVTGSVAVAAGWLWPPVVAVGIALLVEALLTGAFHEDAVADTCDALGGGWDREQTLTIFKDSRLGSYGALGLFLAVGLRWALLAELFIRGPLVGLAATVVAGTLGRLFIVFAMSLVPPVPGRGSSVEVVRSGVADDRNGSRQSRFRRAMFAGLMSMPPLAILLMLPSNDRFYGVGASLTALFVAAAATTGFAAYVQRRLGGIVGDCLGFVCAMSRLIVLLVWVASWPAT